MNSTRNEQTQHINLRQNCWFDYIKERKLVEIDQFDGCICFNLPSNANYSELTRALHKTNNNYTHSAHSHSLRQYSPIQLFCNGDECIHFCSELKRYKWIWKWMWIASHCIAFRRMHHNKFFALCDKTKWKLRNITFVLQLQSGSCHTICKV